MKKHYSLLCTLLAAALAMPVGAQNFGVPSVAKANVAASADDSKNMTVLIDEDFSGFTDGTEDNPSTVNLVDEMGDFANPSALKPYSDALSYKKWGGEGLYAAGGCIAIKDGWFLNTPAGDMSGDIKLTFRARLVKGEGQVINALKLMFISRASLVDYETKLLTLNEDWQTFTYTSNRGENEHSGFQFFSNNDNITILIDDIRLEKVQTSIPAPKVKDAEDITDTSFKAVWEPTADADHYLLNVYSKTENDDYTNVTEGFDNISADDEGNINAGAPAYPDGWSIGWSDIKGKKRVVKGEGSGSGNKQALRFSESDDYITTPRYEDGIKNYKVWLKGEQNSDEVGFGNYIQFTFDTDYGLQDVYSIDMKSLFTPDRINGYYCDLTDAIADFGVKVYAVKASFVRDAFENDPTTLLIDDISLSYKTPAVLNYALKEQRVEKPASEEEETVGYDVTGLDPDTDYYYSVKAVNSEFSSALSDEMEVYAVSQPTALPATDVTADSYTANWTSHSKVDFYRVDQIQQTTMDKDTKDYEVLYEDFSKVISEYNESDLEYSFYEQDEPTSGYMPIDNYTLISGWKASSPIRINGWLGGNQAMGSGKIAGAIVTPTLDLSNNEGSCNISVRAWGSTGDWLIIQGSNPASQGTIEFPEGGFVETTINMPLCTSKEQLTFYSNNYYPFLIDYIKITQDVKAGDKVTTITGAVTTDDETTKSVVMTNPNFGAGHEIYYKVTAMRYDIDSQESHKYYITSNPSELIHVKNPTTGIRSTETVAESVKAVNGGFVVNMAEPATVNVYNMAGQLAASKVCDNGHTFVGVASGVYVVKTAHTTAKVVVK